MGIEDRLRRAIRDRTSSVRVDEAAGLARVNDELHAPGGDDMDLHEPRNRWALAAAAAVVVIVAVAGVAVLRDGDGGGDETADGLTVVDEPTTDPPATGDTAPSGSSGSGDAGDGEDGSGDAGDGAGSDGTDGGDPGGSTEPPGSTTTEPTPEIPRAVARRAVWPRPSSDVRFEEPVAAARSFARYYARFDDAVVGDLRRGDSRSGEVPVRPEPGGPETTVLVRQLGGDDWFVTGSVTGDVSVERPAAGDTVSCPLATSGEALAFEGNVQVRIDAYQPDGDRVEVGRGFVTGSGVPPAGPFSKEIDCTAPSGVESHGMVSYWTEDASGQLTGPVQFVTVPVRLPEG